MNTPHNVHPTFSHIHWVHTGVINAGVSIIVSQKSYPLNTFQQPETLFMCNYKEMRHGKSFILRITCVDRALHIQQTIPLSCDLSAMKESGAGREGYRNKEDAFWSFPNKEVPFIRLSWDNNEGLGTKKLLSINLISSEVDSVQESFSHFVRLPSSPTHLSTLRCAKAAIYKI